MFGLWIRHLLDYETRAIATLPFKWHTSAAEFVLSEKHDDFDVTFSNYTDNQLTSAPYKDVVPPILHHIALGKKNPRWQAQWRVARQSCLDWHPGWEAHLWTDDKAEAFVSKRFPQMYSVWKGYRYPVQRVDALRYMVLYEYGGVILDLDLICNRALGPLRRFDFVAPAAVPSGFSIGFMMASQHNTFVKALVDNLPNYDKQWLGLPYPTIMFSSGCHYASTVYMAYEGRSSVKILPGPLHSLSGRVSTPLFDHLGSSSWHSSDAKFVRCLFKCLFLLLAFFLGIGVAVYIKGSASRSGRSKLV